MFRLTGAHGSSQRVPRSTVSGGAEIRAEPLDGGAALRFPISSGVAPIELPVRAELRAVADGCWSTSALVDGEQSDVVLQLHRAAHARGILAADHDPWPDRVGGVVLRSIARRVG